MPNFLNTFASVLLNAFTLYSLALGLWAGYLGLRGRGLGGQYWGAVAICVGLAALELLVFGLRLLSGEQFSRPIINLLYSSYFIIVFPGTFALLRGRDDRMAALVFAGVAIFTGLAAISYSDPASVRPPLFDPTVAPTLTPTSLP